MKSLDEIWGPFFKAETRSSGAKLVAQEKVSLAQASDTVVHAYVRVAPPLKVVFSCDDISSPSFIVSCTCPAARGTQLCKHVWATLLCVAVKHPDFLSFKTTINKSDPLFESAAESKNRSFKQAAKDRASAYRKEQYQKQKERAKAFKEARRPSPGSFPPQVEAALSYFASNGFDLAPEPSRDAISDAKRKLSRVFHPDRGGSHDEIIELNRHCELLLSFYEKP